MKVVTREYEVYSFEELDAKAKEKVKNWYLDDDDRTYSLTEIFKDEIRLLFPKSELKIQWSLNSCQGDGVNIYGELHLDDVLTLPERNHFVDYLEKYKDYFTEKEKRTIKFYTSYIDNNNGIMLPENRNYSYCIVDRIDFDDIIYMLENEFIRDININIIKKWREYIINIITDICKEWENMGYTYLYEIEDEELEEVCNSNEWCFLKDGTFFA